MKGSGIIFHQEKSNEIKTLDYLQPKIIICWFNESCFLETFLYFSRTLKLSMQKLAIEKNLKITSLLPLSVEEDFFQHRKVIRSIEIKTDLCILISNIEMDYVKKTSFSQQTFIYFLVFKCSFCLHSNFKLLHLLSEKADLVLSMRSSQCNLRPC